MKTVDESGLKITQTVRQMRVLLYREVINKKTIRYNVDYQDSGRQIRTGDLTNNLDEIHCTQIELH